MKLPGIARVARPRATVSKLKVPRIKTYRAKQAGVISALKRVK
jgi:hypothetical protein